MSRMGSSNAGRRARRQVTEELRAGAVRLVLDEDKTVGAVARELDLTPSSLRNWVRHAQADRTHGRTGLTTAEREELAQLRNENRELRTEREILKTLGPGEAVAPAGRETPNQLLSRAPREEWPPAYWCVYQPVKKHGPGVACALDSGDAVRRSCLGK